MEEKEFRDFKLKYTENIDKSAKNLNLAFSSTLNKDISRILQLHFESERYITKAIENLFEEGQRITRPRAEGGPNPFGFYQKLLVIRAIDIISDSAFNLLSAFNNLRNKCAHQGINSISIEMIDAMGKHLGSRYQTIRKSTNNISGVLEQVLKDCLARAMYIHHVSEEFKIKLESKTEYGGKILNLTPEQLESLNQK